MTDLKAFDVCDVFENEMHPQINKLRFIRELAFDCNADFGGYDDERQQCIIAGLNQILMEVTRAWDKSWAEIEKMKRHAKKSKKEKEE